ncbi:MAG: N-acetylmuramoyl-L-alanine amidase [Balneolaceae bacterium]
MKRKETSHIIIHTAAWQGDPSVEDIRRVHVQENGWDDIGYHFVIRKNGDVEIGRPMFKVGAHCKDMAMNHKSVGICLSGHHDVEELDIYQLKPLVELCQSIMAQYSIPVEHVLGHRETGANKTCPGNLVSMVDIRERISWGIGLETAALELNDITLTGGMAKIVSKGLEDLESKTLPEYTHPLPPTKKEPFLKRISNGAKRIFSTRIGETVLAIGIGGFGLFTGINLQPLIEGKDQMDIISAIPLELTITIITGVLTFLVGLFVKKPGTKKFIEARIQAVAPVIVEATSKESEGGKKITPGEAVKILRAAFGIHQHL